MVLEQILTQNGGLQDTNHTAAGSAEDERNREVIITVKEKK